MVPEQTFQKQPFPFKRLDFKLKYKQVRNAWIEVWSNSGRCAPEDPRREAWFLEFQTSALSDFQTDSPSLGKEGTKWRKQVLERRLC